jgi:hypothetical protein
MGAFEIGASYVLLALLAALGVWEIQTLLPMTTAAGVPPFRSGGIHAERLT